MCSDSTNNETRPILVHVAGVSNAGKTTLIQALIPRLRAHGLRVGTVKHAHHGFELDQPGKDSWRHAQAGADAVAIIAPTRAAWLRQTSEELSWSEAVAGMGAQIDLVLIEGFKHQPAPQQILLAPGTSPRLDVGEALCRVGVRSDALSAEEWERIVGFCRRAHREETPWSGSPRR